MASEEIHSKDILVAEDNKINQFLVTHILDHCGYSYRMVENGQEVLDAFRSKKPRLVLMDIQMPVMDGLIAAREIRKLEEVSGQRTPIIAVTARAQADDERLCMEAGMDDYISKPLRLESLSRKLAQWLAAEAA